MAADPSLGGSERDFDPGLVVVPNPRREGPCSAERSVGRALHRTYVGSCGACAARWRAIALSHCSACHEHFGSPSAFDAHWIGTGDGRHCVEPRSLLDGQGRPRLRQITRADGEIWIKNTYRTGDDDNNA